MAEVFTEGNFKSEVLESNIPVLVDFWATWCGPCRMLAPMVDKWAEKYKGKCTVGKLDVDQATVIAAQFGVMSVPTIMLFKGGQVVGKIIGARPGDIERMIEENI